MKIKLSSAITLVSSVAFALPSQGGETVSSKGGIAIAPPAPECSTDDIHPLFSRYAQTAKAITLRAGYRSFKDVELQEADEFDGTTLDVELIVPLSERLQLRFYYPYSTDGDAKHIASGADLDLDGNGGMLDFPSLTLDYQFRQAASVGDYNMAAYVGVGNVRNYIEAKMTSGKNKGGIDRYNHRGSVFLFGFKADKQLNNCWTFVGNVGGRYYWDSDDIHPNSDSDQFFLIDASAAWIYAPSSSWIYPAFEVVYQGDVSDYNMLQVVPQIIIPIGSHIDLNAGVSVGLLDDGPSTEARVQLNISF